MAETKITFFINGKEQTFTIPDNMAVTTITVGDPKYLSFDNIVDEGWYYLPVGAVATGSPLDAQTQRVVFVKKSVSNGLFQQVWITQNNVKTGYACRGRGSTGVWGTWTVSVDYDAHMVNKSNPHGVTLAQVGGAPANITLIDAAESTTLPTLTSGTIQSKIQQIRNNLKNLFNRIPDFTTAAPMPNNIVGSVGEFSGNFIFTQTGTDGWYTPPGGTYAVFGSYFSVGAITAGVFPGNTLIFPTSGTIASPAAFFWRLS